MLTWLWDGRSRRVGWLLAVMSCLVGGLAATTVGRREVSWSRRCPSGGGEPQPEHGQPREVGRSGERPEVGVDPGGAPHPGPAPAVVAAHEMAELAFDLGAGGAVVHEAHGSSHDGVGWTDRAVGRSLLSGPFACQ